MESDTRSMSPKGAHTRVHARVSGVREPLKIDRCLCPYTYFRFNGLTRRLDTPGDFQRISRGSVPLRASGTRVTPPCYPSKSFFLAPFFPSRPPPPRGPRLIFKRSHAVPPGFTDARAYCVKPPFRRVISAKMRDELGQMSRPTAPSPRPSDARRAFFRPVFCASARPPIDPVMPCAVCVELRREPFREIDRCPLQLHALECRLF